MKNFEVKIFNAQPLEVQATSIEKALDKAKHIARLFNLIIIGISQTA